MFHVRLIRSLAFSPIIKITAFVCPATMFGKIEPSTTRKRFIPCTRNCGSTTASSSVVGPILHVPTWWPNVVATWRTEQAQYASEANGKCSQPGNGNGFSVGEYWKNGSLVDNWMACKIDSFLWICCRKIIVKCLKLEFIVTHKSQCFVW